ncbi:MAG TPA: ABC transporter permease subunit [Candidatus Bathyarchaeia archaeon]|nr:ABC transporter permease subunit [Candidatus Bathyarchaeia archaeon]
MSEFSESAYKVLAFAQKDFQSAIKTKRFIIFGAIFFVLALVGAYYGNLDVIHSVAPVSGAPDPATQPVNYAISVSYSYSEIILTIIALALTFDAISGERAARTLAQLVIRPITRRAILLGKFVAYLAATGGLFIVTTFILYAGLTIAMRRVPSASDFDYLILSMGVILLYVMSFIAIGLLISSLTRTRLDSLLGAVFIWILLLVFTYAGVALGLSALNLSATADIPYTQFPGYAKILLWINPGSHNVAIQSLAGDFSKLTSGLNYAANVIFLIASIIVPIIPAYYFFNRSDAV